MNPTRPRALPRRLVLQSGLAGFAAIVADSLVGCSNGMPAAATGAATGSGGAGGAGVGGGGTGGAGSAAAGNEFLYTPIARPKLISKIPAIGPLGAPDANGVRVPAGFSARIVAATGAPPVAGKSYVWHPSPDGGATYPTEDGGWIYVSNSEVPFIGGVGALRFDAAGKLVDTYAILEGSTVNCAGGPTPWDTWLSCEEIASGVVHECDPRGKQPAIVRPALGTFKHEAAAVDPVRHHVYLTEDEKEGCFYRYVPDSLNKYGFANLAAGKLQVAAVAGNGNVTWHDVPDPRFQGEKPTRDQVAAATHFSGGEGIWWHAGVVYFSTKGDGRVRAYDTATLKLTVLYDAKTAADLVLTGVDNITVSCCGDVLVAEDGGDLQIVAILPTGELKALMQVTGQDKSEITGPAFDPSGTRLYFSSQRGPAGSGITYEITGPFHAPA